MLRKPSTWNYWPWAILALFGGMVVSVSFTINLALTEAPVEFDNLYPYGYHEVDERFAQLQAMERRFEAEGYTLEPVGAPALDGGDLALALSRSGEAVEQAQIRALWTRPATTQEDRPAEVRPEGGLYRLEPVALERGGCWQLNLYLTLEDLELAQQWVYYLPHQAGAVGRRLDAGQACNSHMD